MQITLHYATLIAAIEERLTLLLNDLEVNGSRLNEAARYTVLGGGKRLRPLLCLLTAKLYNVPIDKALSVACAIELLHCYSLIHDDLPAMDNDNFRRGRPTLHRVFGEGHAILTGDYLLTYAFEIISGLEHIPERTRLDIISLLSKSCGAMGMAGGQAIDLATSGQRLSIEELQLLHHNKTGKLIEASILTGALLGNAPKEEIEQLSTFGKHFGLAFQIADDLLDITDSTTKRGQNYSSDLANNKSTYATLLGIEMTRQRLEESLLSMKLALADLQLPTQELLSLTTAMVIR